MKNSTHILLAFNEFLGTNILDKELFLDKVTFVLQDLDLQYLYGFIWENSVISKILEDEHGKIIGDIINDNINDIVDFVVKNSFYISLIENKRACYARDYINTNHSTISIQDWASISSALLYLDKRAHNIEINVSRGEKFLLSNTPKFKHLSEEQIETAINMFFIYKVHSDNF